MITLDWYGLYGEGWAGEIVDEAFSHPTKFARGLIRRIYEHAMGRGWLTECNAVLDPFGGVGLGGLDAMFQGLHWVGVELEPKFVELGQQNIALWDRRYNNGMLPRWGSAILLQGDSRRLCEVLGGARAQACVSSPPYAESLRSGKSGIDWSKRADFDRRNNPTTDGSVIRGESIAEGYSTNPANLGNMREGDFAAVVSSPAYAGARIQQEGAANADNMRRPNDRGRYGDSPGQLGAMKEGDVDAVISSPPYAKVLNGRTNQDQGDREHRISIGRNPDSPGSGYPRFYGQSPGQLAAMPEGEFGAQAVVSSPPYSELNTKTGKVDSNSWSDGRPRQVGSSQKESDGYGINPDNLGNAQGDTFWSAARLIVRQCHQALVPGGVAIWVLKDFVRAKKRVQFCDQWRRMCEACGFESLEWIRAWLVEDRGAQWALNGELVEKKVERKSFFRRLHEKKYPDLSIDYEVVLVMRKPQQLSMEGI